VRPVKFDLAAHMRERGLLMAAHETRHDPASVTAGRRTACQLCIRQAVHSPCALQGCRLR
jgi:hypothetical protein